MTATFDLKYPIYIISKGRADSRLTAKALESIGVKFRIVIEPQELGEYSRVIDKSKILVLPFSNLGQGSIPARNWVWDHSRDEGHKRHWILDDNIRSFKRWNNSRRQTVGTGKIFRLAEDFIDRYANVPMAGFEYYMFAAATITGSSCKSPFRLNSRIYSCILLSNSTNIRWRGRYNEDTDLSIRFLKAGYCTILFLAFLCQKSTTMTMSGGNTEQLYKQDSKFDGRLEMAKSLKLQHPDIDEIKWKYGRWHHDVDYSKFKSNKLLKRLQ